MSINVGIVGLGFMGQMHARCYQALPGVNLVACADGQEERRANFERDFGCVPYASYAELLYHTALDVVDVCLPTPLHREAVVQGLGAGKHVMCEKPIALTLEDADAMLAVAERSGTYFMVGHVIRFWPEYVALKRILDGGELGRVLFAEARRLSPSPAWSWQNWLLQADKSGGAVIDLHIHDLDFLRWVMGDPTSVFATGFRSGKGWGTIATSLTFPGGAGAVATGSLDLAPGYPFTMGLVVSCERGTLLLDSARTPSLVVMRGEAAPEAVELPAAPVAKAEGLGNVSDLGGYFNEIAYFIECIRTGSAPETVTPRDAREALRLCLAARESAESGKPVTF